VFAPSLVRSVRLHRQRRELLGLPCAVSIGFPQTFNKPAPAGLFLPVCQPRVVDQTPDRERFDTSTRITSRERCQVAIFYGPARPTGFEALLFPARLLTARHLLNESADRSPDLFAPDLIQSNQSPVGPRRHLRDRLTINLRLAAKHLCRRDPEYLTHLP
jgi:hypothetical protein